MAKKKRRKLSSDRYSESYASKDTSGVARQGFFDYGKVEGGVSFYKPQEGLNKLVIVPYEIKSKNHPLVKQGKAEIGDLDYVFDIWAHMWAGASGANILCPKKTYGKPCPICDIVKEMYDRGEDKEAKKVQAKRRVAYNVLEVNNGEVDDELKVFEVAHYSFEKELIEEANACANGRDIVNFADLEEGSIIKFRYGKGSDGIPKYKSFDFLEREEELDDSLIDNAISFGEALVILTPQQITELYEGDEEDEEDAPPPKRKRVEEDAEEEEEEPTPKKAPPKKEKENENGNGGNCPEGYAFGKDCDGQDECNRCELWEECMEASEA